MDKCIYVITQSFFNNRDKERFGINYFLSKKYKVIVIDATMYLQKTLKITHEHYSKENNLIVHSCKNIDSIKNILGKREAKSAILYIGPSYKSTKIKKILRKNKVSNGLVQTGFIPFPQSNQSLSGRVIFAIKRHGFLRFIINFWDKLMLKIFDDSNYDFIITSNLRLSSNNHKKVTSHNIIPTNSFDYDIYLNIKDKPKLRTGRHAVFIDQNMSDCKDFLRFGINLNLDETIYYKELNTYFDFIEKTHDCVVVIAAHPKSDINRMHKQYPGKEVLINTTALIIRDSILVINHYSTAISFAVLYRKPITFISSNTLKNTIVEAYIAAFSKSLGMDMTNISHTLIAESLSTDCSLYLNYENKYIKPINTNTPSWELIHKSLVTLKHIN